MEMKQHRNVFMEKTDSKKTSVVGGLIATYPRRAKSRRNWNRAGYTRAEQLFRNFEVGRLIGGALNIIRNMTSAGQAKSSVC